MHVCSLCAYTNTHTHTQDGREGEREKRRGEKRRDRSRGGIGKRRVRRQGKGGRKQARPMASKSTNSGQSFTLCSEPVTVAGSPPVHRPFPCRAHAPGLQMGACPAYTLGGFKKWKSHQMLGTPKHTSHAFLLLLTHRASGQDESRGTPSVDKDAGLWQWRPEA